jgi:hypothetical protein
LENLGHVVVRGREASVEEVTLSGWENISSFVLGISNQAALIAGRPWDVASSK